MRTASRTLANEIRADPKRLKRDSEWGVLPFRWPESRADRVAGGAAYCQLWFG